MNKIIALTCLVALIFTLSACAPTPNAAQTNIAAPSSAAASKTPSSASVGQNDNLTYTPAPSPIPTATTSSTPAPAAIVVTASKGNVFIRRGPDFAYNAVSVLMDGQSVHALARDVLANWVQIPVPDRPNETGWISVQTRFIAVSGDVMKLPGIMPADWPVLASLRNCTRHYMAAEPGGIVIPAAYAFPDNDVQINPGVYTIHDIEVDGSPEVMQVEIKEGSEVDIREDGNGEHKKCAQAD